MGICHVGIARIIDLTLGRTTVSSKIIRQSHFGSVCMYYMHWGDDLSVLHVQITFTGILFRYKYHGKH